MDCGGGRGGSEDGGAGKQVVGVCAWMGDGQSSVVVVSNKALTKSSKKIGKRRTMRAKINLSQG